MQILLSSSLLCKNLKIKTYRTIILTVVLYECETWPLKSMEGRTLRVFKNRVLRRIFGPKGDDVIGRTGNCTMRRLMICTSRPVIFG